MNIFANAAVKPATKSTTKKEANIFPAPELGSNIQELQTLRTNLANTEARIKMLEGIIKEAATGIYLDQYEKGRRRPDTLKIADQEGAACSFIVMDRYSKVEAEKAAILEAIDPDLIETTRTYSFDPALLDKHGLPSF